MGRHPAVWRCAAPQPIVGKSTFPLIPKKSTSNSRDLPTRNLRRDHYFSCATRGEGATLIQRKEPQALRGARRHLGPERGRIGYTERFSCRRHKALAETDGLFEAGREGGGTAFALVGTGCEPARARGTDRLGGLGASLDSACMGGGAQALSSRHIEPGLLGGLRSGRRQIMQRPRLSIWRLLLFRDLNRG